MTRSGPPLSPREGWIGDGRQVLHFRPLRHGRWSQALEPEAPGRLDGLPAAVDPAAAVEGLRETTAPGSARQHGDTRDHPVLLNPFCPLSTAKVLALKATVLLLLTMLIKARVQIAAGSALGIFLLLLQTLVFLAISGGLVLAAGGAAIYATQRRRPAAT